MKLQLFPIVLCLLVATLFSCSRSEEKSETTQPSPAEIPVITIMTHDSFSVSKGVFEQFEKKLQAKLVIYQSGDAGEALNKAILAKNNPLADIFYGVDSTFLSRALKADMFIPYTPQHLDTVDKSLQLDPENRLVPVDFGDVCLNYDIEWFKEHNLLPPTRLEDLIKPEYLGLTVVQNPATSSPGLAFLLATISRFGEDGYLDYWQKLKANKVEITNGWKDAYWGKFTAASEGDRPIVVSYASSPAAEVFYSETKLSKAPTAVVLENNSAFRQIEFAGILKGTAKLELAKKAMDFILSAEFQEDIPLQMFVFPANSTAALPLVFQEHAQRAESPAFLDPQLIDAKREIWLREWIERML
ncbi:MAG: thiamine ABC transporter substrate-binding protein [Desulfuromusa sp.]|nr:thiamine ABC transporter substrate-binding protein [Desulfuromusa sp.]